MQYLWINPVSAGMCEEDSLKRFLERHGLTRVECRGDRRQPDSAGVFCGNLPERWTGGEGRECQQSGENPGICGERKLEAGGFAGTFVL